MRSILLVDSSSATRQNLRQIFEDSDFTFDESNNGVDAVKMFKVKNYDLVMMGLAMPEMDGIEALQAIKKINSDAKVIIITSLADRELVVRAAKAGATDFVVVPFEPRRVVASVKKVLSIIEE